MGGAHPARIQDPEHGRHDRHDGRGRLCGSRTRADRRFWKAELTEFYATHFIPKMPPDLEIIPVSRTIGSDQLVEELVLKFTHSIEMDWMLPGIPPTNRRVEAALVVVVRFRDGKVAHEHIYWDQASVLVQIGLLDPKGLPVAGVESARKCSILRYRPTHSFGGDRIQFFCLLSVTRNPVYAKQTGGSIWTI